MSKFTTFLSNLTTKPGVYQMYDSKHQILYVGKAKNLRKRVSSYFRTSTDDPKTQSLMEQVVDIEVIITQNENDALLLENNLIKTLKPKYNIIFKDDKSYLYLLLTDHACPAIMVYRGAKTVKGKYFGPYPKGKVVYETLNLLQKLFQLRVCSDQVFATRSRPCLQYQIKRCTAPCVKLIDPKEYQRNVRFAELFLKGENDLVIQEMVRLMEEAARNLNFERASFYRDQIRSLRNISEQQVMIKDKGELDVIALVQDNGNFAINLLTVRRGHVIGSKNYFPQLPKMGQGMSSAAYVIDSDGDISGEILADFITQHYLNHDHPGVSDFPRQIIANNPITNQSWIEVAITQVAGKKITITSRVKKDRARLVQLAAANALYALRSQQKFSMDLGEKFVDLQRQFGLTRRPEIIEGFDVSHLGGEATVVSCVVFGVDGPEKTKYRKFNIKLAGAADDYAALKEALERHYKDLAHLPAIILLDGGKGQLKIAIDVLQQLGRNSLEDSSCSLIAIAKGEGRHPGKEKIFRENQDQPLAVDNHSPAFHLLQQIRDEAHRFAISGQRRRFAKTKKTSILENISGIGAKRRKNLLLYFGGIQGLEQAKVADIAKVAGISLELAKKIHEFLHNK